MSGDVQPRKRKDKKRKRDGADRKSEGEVTFSRQSSVQDDDESSHGVHITKMGGDDVHLHVQHDHGTGGHWCAKILFFSLLAILLGLVGLIILENRGLSDLDTPLSESRFSNYFDGWVEEHRQEHDEHDPVQASIEEHDEHDEPFEEEDDNHSEGDEDDNDDDDDDEHADDENDNDDENDDEDDGDKVEAEDEDTRDVTQEDKDDNDDEDEDEDEADDDNDEADVTAEEDDDDDNNEKEDTTKVNVKTAEDNNDNDDDDDDDGDNDDEDGDNDDEENNNNANDDDDDNDDNIPNKIDDDDDDDNDNDDEDADDDVSAPIKSTTLHSQNAASQQQKTSVNDDEDDDPFDEEDDDGTFESIETVVDNDAEELSLLQEKARQQAAEAAKNAPPSAEDDTDDPAEDAPSWAFSLAVKIGVGVALALVARIVLLRKNPNATDEPVPELLMKRRLTIATAEDTFLEDEDAPPLPTEDEEFLGDEEEEEIVVEEEIEYIETDDEEAPIQNVGTVSHQQKRYLPETFEELNALYKPYIAAETEQSEADALAEMRMKAENVIYRKSPSPLNTEAKSAGAEVDPEPVLGAKHTPANMSLYSARPTTSAVSGAIPKVDKDKESTYAKGTTREVTHDADYQPDDEDIDYDIDDDVYEEEEVVEEEEDELEGDDDANGEGDVSDFDDEELMNRLEIKYGKLPQREHEYESDEDPDDPTWTQIKPKEARGGGPQAEADSDIFEQELRRANEEMMRENYAVALTAFDMLSRKFPDQPQVFLGKAQNLDRLSARERSNKLLHDALEAYKRYLAFDELIELTAFRAAAERCIDRMRFLGLHIQTVPIHEQLIERFSDDVGIRNQLVVSYLMMNRLTDAKRVLQETLRRWPMDGFAQVHYGFVLKQLDRDYHNAVVYLERGINSQDEGTQDGRFFFNLGDALQRLGRKQEALDVYQRGVVLKLFPSVYQRSLYNEPNLRAQPFWSKKETTYDLYLDKLEQNWLAIRDEGLSLLGKRGHFLDEVENLRDTGDWQQFELYVRGQRIHNNCQKAPITCSLIEHFNAASGCRRGQVKFSVMQPGTHVWSHCGPTNCRLRAHLGLVVPQGTRLRVADEERSWTEGEFLIFDDSFEHEVWHEGSSLRLVLIVDIWHPDLNEKQRQRLTPI